MSSSGYSQSSRVERRILSIVNRLACGRQSKLRKIIELLGRTCSMFPSLHDPAASPVNAVPSTDNTNDSGAPHEEEEGV